MINIDDKTYKDIKDKVGHEKMRQIERDCGIPDAPPQNLAGNIIGAEHIAKSERDGIPTHKISMSGFERDNLGKSFIFTEEKVVEEYKRQIIDQRQ